MNEIAKQAVNTALRNAEDNLYRAKLQKKASPTWVSGDGQHIDEMIAGYQKDVDELKEALK